MLYIGSQAGNASMNSSWDMTVEGTQNFADYSDHGDMAQETEESTYQVSSLDEYHQPSKWALGVPGMQRTPSESSAGSYKQRTVRASVPRSRPRIHTDISQGPSALFASVSTGAVSAGYGMTGDAFSSNSALAATMPMASVPGYFPESCAVTSGQLLDMPQHYLPIYHGLPAYTQDSLSYTAELGQSYPLVQQHVNPACTQVVDLDDRGVMSSPWASSVSSPDNLDDTWSNQHASSPAESQDSALSFAPPPDAEDGIKSEMAGEFAMNATYQRSNSEGDAVRDHPLYRDALPDEAGLYHCPWEGDSNCNHKPEKLKCNYDKFVDSHMKPYRCKHNMCENTHFSSTACLLRHEREAHAMHGHGDKPYLCTHKGCDRSYAGNGFPRQWNLKDHMRRVHHDASPVASAAATLPSPPTSSSSQAINKSRKRKKDSLSSNGSSSPRKVSSSSRSGKGQQACNEDEEMERSRAAAAKAAMEERMGKWNMHRKALELTFANLGNYYDPETATQLEEANKHFMALQSLASKEAVTGTVAFGRSQQSG